MKRSAAATVLSALPLDAVARASLVEEFGAETRFFDLQALRRLSFAALFATMRAVRPARVIVIGSEEDVQQFGNYLLPLAACVPASRHEIRSGSAGGVAISRLQAVAPVVARIPLAFAAGLGAAMLTWCESRLRLVVSPKDAPWPARADRCLYLKPGLNFGRPVGGSVAHVAGVVNALLRRGMDVSIVASQHQAAVAPRVPQQVVRADFVLSSSHELNQHRYRKRFAAAALAKARSWQPDFIYQRFALNDFSGARLRSRLGIPLVVEFNGSEVWIQRHWGRKLIFERAARTAERAALRAADLIIAVSEEVGAQAVAAGVAPEKILCYPNGVDENEFDPGRFSPEDTLEVRARLGVPGDRLLYTFVGTFGEWHGTEVLAGAVLALRERRASWLRENRAHILFVGDGPLSASVRERLGGAVKEELVTFAGLRPHAEAPGILAASDILVSPHKPNADGSPFFGSPTKLFEYMAMARPIVASDLDQIGEVLRGGKPAGGEEAAKGDPAAVLVTPGDVDSLADGLWRAGSMDSTERERMGRRARELVLRNFTWDRNVAAVLGRMGFAESPPV